MCGMLGKGRSLKELYEAFPSDYVRYYRGLENVQFIINNVDKPRGEPNIVWLWGDSGAGKTRIVSEAFPLAFWKTKDKWWDGYNYEDCIVFDEFYGWLEYDQLLRLLDWYPLKAERKGGHIQVKATTFIFTSNDDPRDLYRNVAWRRRQAFYRRLIEFGEVWHFSSNSVEKDSLMPFFRENNADPVAHDQRIPARSNRFSPY